MDVMRYYAVLAELSKVDRQSDYLELFWEHECKKDVGETF